jgi:curved DNA-binding protein CbpA
VLQLPREATREAILAKHRELAMQRHPDQGGSNQLMAELNRARDQALQDVAA